MDWIRTAWARFKPKEDEDGDKPRYPAFVGTLLTLSILCQSLLLAGCNSTSVPLTPLYILPMRYNLPRQLPLTNDPNNTTVLDVDQEFEVRVGYFGICMHHPAGQWKCASTEDYLPVDQLSRLDPYHILRAGRRYKDEVIFPAIIIINSVLMVFILVNFCHYKRSTSQNWKMKLKTTGLEATTLCVANILNSMAALWQHTSAASVACLLDVVSSGSVDIRVGYLAAGLVWTPMFLLAILICLKMSEWVLKVPWYVALDEA
ncbi:Ca2+ regulator and membrane fusion protein Fig1-domain-containing protein [Massariosphaeria phaeospora]|uniref:Ca2+ regulator and membrane fusion protein Fig1-domain-containing protein n=1 Tax=Massariosphaeria phaeospora TaxID=100035 RepID=A0A7C8MDP4_9PLEO|nr:Ca2+ regulator and membrane fusion protein Fig1-domain-containing protein [Massariosphaeria phaeospora]